MQMSGTTAADQNKSARDSIRDSFADDVFSKTGVSYSFEYSFAKPDRKWRSDVAWPDVKVALEIDGGTWSYGRHNRASSVLADMEKNNGYSERGWLVFHTPWAWLKSPQRRAFLLSQIVAAISSRTTSES